VRKLIERRLAEDRAAGLRHAMVTLDASGTPVSAGDWVLYCSGKPVEYVHENVGGRIQPNGTFLGTRCTPEQAGAVSAAFPAVRHNPLARTIHLPVEGAPAPGPDAGAILVISAGTSDLPVAEEAAVVAEAFGHRVSRLVDVGVAGLHRLLAAGDQLREADVVIVVAGMEGALPSVVGGLVKAPVIAVPTSVGYGAAFGGLAALLGMLNSCAAGVTVVNIDNGFGAAAAASRICAP